MQYPITLTLACLALTACIEGPVTINVPELPDLPALSKGAAGAAAPVPSAMAGSTAKPAPTTRARAVAAVAPTVKQGVTSVESDAGVDSDAGDEPDAVEPVPAPGPTPDAGAVDAGSAEPDAGTVDAGSVEPDAGPPPPPPPPPRCVLDSGQIMTCNASFASWHPDWVFLWTVQLPDRDLTYRCNPQLGEQVCAKGTFCSLSIPGAAIQWGTCQ